VLNEEFILYTPPRKCEELKPTITAFIPEKYRSQSGLTSLAIPHIPENAPLRQRFIDLKLLEETPMAVLTQEKIDTGTYQVRTGQHSSNNSPF